MSDEDEDPAARRRALSPVLGWEEFRPLSSSVRVQFGARSHAGLVQPVNTDHYLVVRLGRDQETLTSSLSSADLPARFEESAYCMLVADGLGAQGAGAVASRVAISTFAHLALHFGKWNVRVDGPTSTEIIERADWFYRKVHDAVLKRSRTDPALSDMATTLTAAYSAGDELFFIHVGHSRAYLFRNGVLSQLSKDQTVAQRMAETAGPTPVGWPTDDLRHILTDTLGGRVQAPHVQVEHFRIWDEDVVLLCTDGLTDMVGEEKIADVLALRRDLNEQCHVLVDLALDAGGKDNVTVVLAQFSIPKP